MAILNFSKITCTFPDGGLCDCTMWIITDFNFSVFAPTGKYKVYPWRPFWILVKPQKNHLHISILWEMWYKIWIISFLKFCSFCAHKNFWSWPLAAILKFGSIFKKSLAHPHVSRNVMLKFKQKLTKQIFLHSPKNSSWSVAAILNFSKTLKKSPAHLHSVGNVIVKFKKILTLSFRVFAPTVALWWPFWIMVASLNNHLHIPMLLRMSCWNFKKICPVVFEFLRHTRKRDAGCQTPDRILARLKSPFPYGRGIKSVKSYKIMRSRYFKKSWLLNPLKI